MITIPVEADGSGYQVLVGKLSEALPQIEALGGGRSLPMVTDARLLALHGEILAPVSLQPPIVVAEGESAKNWSTLAAITDALAERNVRRGTPIIAFGGGSIGDVTGLAASLYKRGCPVIHVPTTLLAQADSAIGGKTAIDSAGIKNLIGTFQMPALVIADPSLLDTLDPPQLRSGYAEIVKYGLIDDPAFFVWCEAHGSALIAGDREARRHAVIQSIRAKARIVAADPLDKTGQRALLNLGHSFGHAIEATAGIGRLLHGEAVAIGLVLAFRLSAMLGHCPEEESVRVANLLASIGLPVGLEQVGLVGTAETLIGHMRQDKKVDTNRLTLVLVHGIGRAFLDRNVSLQMLYSFLSSF
jgi:3-dehydroquinate synthase